jgi:deoxyribodipyrimidine photo-lyase
MQAEFKTDIESIEQRIQQVNCVAYTNTRNYTTGSVSYLSPYIARGVVSLPYIRQQVLKRYTPQQAYAFIFELAWREYFQRVWWQMGNNIFADIKQPQVPIATGKMPKAILNAETGIEAIDTAINKLYATGYMHNHVRMYTAAITCNIANAHWRMPATWLYYHLLDGDLASNMLSWQWVAGTFSSKKYYCNQQNVNKFCGTNQQRTFLDEDYSRLPNMPIPDVLKETADFKPQTQLPETPQPVFDYSLPLHIYNSYHLSPTWRSNEAANRVLLLEPSHFSKYPVGPAVIDFIIGLSKNIPGIQIFCGEAKDIPGLQNFKQVITRAHPTSTHYPATHDQPEWLFPQVTEVKGSFMNFWKKAERYLTGE